MAGATSRKPTTFYASNRPLTAAVSRSIATAFAGIQTSNGAGELPRFYAQVAQTARGAVGERQDPERRFRLHPSVDDQKLGAPGRDIRK